MVGSIVLMLTLIGHNKVFMLYRFLIGVLQVPSRTCKYLGQQWGGEMCLNVASLGHLLKCKGT